MDALQKIFSVFLCIILFAFAAADIAAIITKININKDTITEVIDEIDLMSVFNFADFTNITNVVDNIVENISDKVLEEADNRNNEEDEEKIAKNEEAEDDEEAIINWVYDSINQEYIDEYDIKKENVKNIYSKSGVEDFLKGKVTGYIDQVISGGEADPIKSKEIVGFIEENKDIIYEEIGYNLEPEDYDSILQFLDENEFLDDLNNFNINDLSGLINFSGFTLDSIGGIAGKIIDFIINRFDFVFSSYIIYAVIILTTAQLFILLILILVNKKNLRSVFICCGVTYCICGLAYTAGGISLYIVSERIMSAIYQYAGFLSSSIENILNRFNSSVLSSGLITASGGVLLIAIYIIIRKTKTKNTITGTKL